MDEPRETDQVVARAPGRTWSPFELLLIAVAVWVTLMALVCAGSFFLIGGD